MPKRDFSLKRQPKYTNPQKLYNTLCAIYPQYMAEEYFKDLMGYAPPKEWRKPETPLHIFSEEEKHGTTDN
ncbi:MAG: hypothetical protein J6Q14_08250 [Oscillospiraceae bacterium]|nr:hypothetical protein [Oscillospiraceae bacterium]